jgi:hypothetical protein
MKELHQSGIGLVKRQAEPITPRKENQLWESNQLGEQSADSLLNTVFFYNCKLFGLRGLDEHRDLQCSQIVLGLDENGSFITFNGRSSKSMKGGLKHRKLTAKYIKHYVDITCNRNLFTIYQHYLVAVGNDGDFYKRPLNGLPIRFSKQNIGKHKMATLIKNMCKQAGLNGFFSNHSGKRTCATVLFQKGVDQQQICKRTGHRSDAIEDYKVPSAQQEKFISSCLNPPQPFTANNDVLSCLPAHTVCMPVQTSLSTDTMPSTNSCALPPSYSPMSGNFTNCTFNFHK